MGRFVFDAAATRILAEQDFGMVGNGSRRLSPLRLKRSIIAALTAIAAVAACIGTPSALRAQSTPDLREHSAFDRLAMTIEEKNSGASNSPHASGELATGALPTPKAELTAGGVRARLKVLGAGTHFSAGTPVFAEITLTNLASKKPLSAELLFSTEVAEIKHVQGKRVKTTQTDVGRNAAVSGLRKGKSRRVTVELLLKASTDASGSAAANKLLITLKRPGADTSDSTVVSWPVADCATSFYAEITKIREQNSDRIGPALKAAWQRDRRRPGSWLFRPAVSTSKAKRRCVRWQRRWDYRKGRYRSRCVRYRTIRPAVRRDIKVTKEERQLVRFASPLVRSRAIDPKLSSKQHYGWIAQKVANDLRGYLKQQKHPAICTGVLRFTDYYTDRMSDLEKRRDEYAAKLSEGRKIAFARMIQVRDAVKADPGGHPGWGAMPLTMIESAEKSTLQELIVDLLELTGGDVPLDDVRRAENTYAALKAARSLMSKDRLKSLDKQTRAEIRYALGLIEAADYIGEVARQYNNIDSLITGSLRAMRKAHGQHCNCSY